MKKKKKKKVFKIRNSDQSYVLHYPCPPLYHSPLFTPISLPLFPFSVPPLVCAAPPIVTFSSVLLPFPVSASVFLSLSRHVCFSLLLCPSYSLTLSSCVVYLSSPSFLPSSSPLSPFISMVVSRLGPPGLGAGEVWAAYTTVFIPLSSSLYSSKALHFFYWVSSE